MVAQLSYPEDQAIGIPGALADIGNNDVLSRLAEDALIPFGRFITVGTDKDTQGKLPSIATDITDIKKALGISVHSHARESVKDQESGYKITESMSVLHKGRIFMAVEEAMDSDSLVFVRFSGKQQEQTITWDQDFVTSNTVDGFIDGVAMAQVPFNTSHAQTLTDVSVAIKATSAKVDTATVTGAREITVTAILDQTVLIGDFTVLAGSQQAVETIVETVALILEAERGRIRTDADSTTAAQLVGARILQSAASAGEIAVLQVDL